MRQTIILGNIITMDEKRPFAKAALVKDGVFAYIGGAETAKQLAAPDAQVLDYGENYIYPGFLESHCHSYLAGDRSIGQANLAQVGLTDYAKYREIIKEYIKKNPQREFYLAAGWVENDEYVTKAYLDEICSDKPLFMQTGGGHSMLLNTKALEWAGIDAAYAKKMGYDLVHVDENGEPDGYICEAPVFELYPKLPTTLENAKDYLLAWQDMALANGYTAVADAGVEVTNPIATKAFYELEQEGKLKLRTYAYLMCPDNPEDPKAEVARIAADRAKYSGEYFHVVGVKTFLDGVTEAHTGWQNQDYPTSRAIMATNASTTMTRWWNSLPRRMQRDFPSMSTPREAARPTSCWTASRMRKRSPAIWISAMSWRICTLSRTRISAAWAQPAPFRQFLRCGLRKFRASMRSKSLMSERNWRTIHTRSSPSLMRAQMWFSIRTIRFLRRSISRTAFTWRKPVLLRSRLWAEIPAAISRKPSPANNPCRP